MTKDATWGNCNVISYNYIETVGELILSKYNPFRYRGYYYDTDTSLYYLESRYYNPQWGRFINPDRNEVITATPDQLTDNNLFAYCDNNPVMRADEDGEFWNFVIGAAVGAVVGGLLLQLTEGTRRTYFISFKASSFKVFITGAEV